MLFTRGCDGQELVISLVNVFARTGTVVAVVLFLFGGISLCDGSCCVVCVDVFCFVLPLFGVVFHCCIFFVMFWLVSLCVPRLLCIDVIFFVLFCFRSSCARMAIWNVFAKWQTPRIS